MAYLIQGSVFNSEDRNIVNAGIATLTDINVSGLITATNVQVYSELRDSVGNVGAGNSLLVSQSGALTWTPITALGIATDFAPGNTYFVADNGSDANTGQTVNSPWGSIGFALANIPNGENNILIVSAGEYEETFPLSVPKGLTIRGAGQRATIIRPTSATETNDGFEMDNATTVEDLTITGFYKPQGSDNHAFVYSAGAALTTRSPYVSRVTVLNRGTSNVVTAANPYGYTTLDNYPTTAPAGGGVFADASIIDSSSVQAGFLLNETTLFTPGNTGVCLKSGSRVEMSDSFTYFAETAVEIITDTASGVAGNGRTRLTVVNPTAGIVATNSIQYYDTDGTTLLASGIVDEVSGGYVYLTNAGTGTFETTSPRVGVSINFVGGAQISTAQQKFGLSSLDVTSSTTSAVTAESSNFGFGTGDFTIEGFFYFNSLTSGATLYDFRNTALSDNRISVNEDGSGNLVVRVANSVVITSTGNPISATTWHHVALTRNGTSLRLFVDGVDVGNASTGTDLGNTATLHIGADLNDANGIDAFVDDWRIEKGVAKYISGFTAPTAALKGDKDTAILLHFEGSNGDTTTTDDTDIFQDIRITGGVTADRIALADYSEFGGDLRSIGCSYQYGSRGVVGDGAGSLAHLISVNFSYIGLLGDLTNDATKAVQANEIIETNGADLYFTSVDQNGDFRVGNSFYVNQETGTVSFTNTATDLTSLSSLTITDGSNSSLITPTSGRFGNLQLSGNTLESVTGDVNIVTAGAGEVNIEGNTNISGILTAASISLGAIQNGDTSIALDDTGSDGTIRFITDGSEAGRFDNSNNLTVVNDINANGNIVGDTATNISGIASVTADNFYGDGSGLTNIAADNVDLTGTYQSLAGIAVTGPGVALTVTNDVSIGGSVTAGFYYGDGSNLTGIGIDGTHIEPLSIETGIITATNINASGIVTATSAAFFGAVAAAGSITAASYFGDGSGLAGVVTSISDLPDPLPVNDVVVSGYISVASTATFGGHVQRNDGMSVSGIATATEFDALSDIRLKENISPVDNALNKLVGITGVSYTWKDSGDKSVGVIAQDVHAVFPELVQEQEYLSVNYNGLIGVLIESVKELKDRVEELEAKLNDH